MPKVNRHEVDKKDFLVVKDTRTLDVTKVIAPHELQIGLEGYKRASLRIEGDEHITGQLIIGNGCKGALKLLDGTSAIKAGVGTIVTTGSNGSATVALDTAYIASQQAGVTVTPNGGISSTADPTGLLSLSISPSFLPSKMRAGTGIEISNNGGQLTISTTRPNVVAGSGISSNLVNNNLTLGLNVIAGSGVRIDTNGSGQVVISSTSTGEVDLSGYAPLAGATFSGPLIAAAGLSGSLTKLSDGSTPYLVGGSGVQVITGSNGQVQVSLAGPTQGGTVTDLALNVELAGDLDGVNTVFTAPHVDIDESSFMLWLNGQLLTKDSDYSVSSNTVTFINDVVPVATDVLRVMYSRQITTKLFALAVEPTEVAVVNDEVTGLTLPQNPDPSSSLMLFLNGQLLTQGHSHDYSLSGNVVTFARSLLQSDVFRATYSYVI